jgi:DNA polymerase IV
MTTRATEKPAPARTIFHVDMDAFFASVEVLDDPRLRGKPVLVGGTGSRGVVAAASYEARAHGCRSAQPMAEALRSCPAAIVLPPRQERYAAVSSEVFEVFESFSPVVEALSIDEAFLDMTGTERLFGPPRAAAEALRRAVYERTGGLTCSVGIAAVKFLAKIASGHSKPDAVTEIKPGTELAFLDGLPIAELWGVGPKTAARLTAHGVRTVGALRRLGAATLVRWFGESGARLHRLSRADDPRPVEGGRARLQISHEDTYATDIGGRDALRSELLSQAMRVADRLTTKRMRARRVQLKIRDDTFRTETRQCTLAEPTRQGRILYDAVCTLLDTVDLQGRKFRLTGVAVGALVCDTAPAPKQLDLLASEADDRGDELQGVLTEIRTRFGRQALFVADTAGKARSGTGAITRTPDTDDDGGRD